MSTPMVGREQRVLSFDSTFRLVISLLGMSLFAFSSASESPVQSPGALDLQTLNPEDRALVFKQVIYSVRWNPESIRDLVPIDIERVSAFRRLVRSDDEWSLYWPEFFALGRPQDECDLILAELSGHIAQAQEDECNELRESMSSLRFLQIASNDSRIAELLVGFICNSRPPNTDDCGLAQAFAVYSLGMIHTPNATDFFQDSLRQEFWRSLPFALGLPKGLETDRWVYSMVNAALDGIASLPCSPTTGIIGLPVDTAVQLLEEYFKTLGSEHPYFPRHYKVVLQKLDKLWQHKKGEYQDRLVKVSAPWGEMSVQDPYPDWLYGPQGKKIHVPFGKDPEEPWDMALKTIQETPDLSRPEKDRIILEGAIRSAELYVEVDFRAGKETCLYACRLAIEHKELLAPGQRDRLKEVLAKLLHSYTELWTQPGHTRKSRNSFKKTLSEIRTTRARLQETEVE